jgi:hypothetical protein
VNERRIDQVLRETRPGSGERVLVAVMNNSRDLEIARHQHWYRIPVKRAPKRVGADYLAFYLTGAFGPDERHRVSLYAPIHAYRLATRIELLPDEPEHPRALERYFRIEIGPLQRLARPIPSKKLRRITFIPTTLERLLNAQQVNDLWDKGRHQDELWAALKAHEIDAERQVEIQETGTGYVADFVISCRRGQVIVLCEEQPERDAPNVLCFTPEQLLQASADCVRRIGKTLALYK